MSGHRYFNLGCKLAVAILVAVWVGVLILPLRVKLSELAHERACLGNVRQLTQAMLMYAQDHDQRLPDMVSWTPLTEYYKNNAVIVCPSDRRLSVVTRLDLLGDYRKASLVSYGLLQRWGHQKLPLAAQASRAVAVYEVGENGLDYRHFDGMYLGFLDGHVKWYQQSKIPPEMILSGRK